MSSKRIIANTAATYLRSLLALGMALFSSRWVITSLGQSDFGLYSVVGSIIVFIVFLNSVMSWGAARFFAFSIGRGDLDEVNRWFNAALSIHICSATFLAIVGWPLGEYVVGHLLTIPADRIQACLWVFRISLISAFVSMLSVPFVAMFTAQQRMAELAVWGLLQTILTFSLAFSLRFVEIDKLLFYAAGMVAIVVTIQIAQIIRGFIVFNECQIRFDRWFDWVRLKEVFSFSGWNLIGSTGGLLRDQGSAILLNLYYGPYANAAYGVATQVSAQTSQLSAAMVGAFSPEITASEGRGDRSRMLSLANRASKFGTLLVLILALPLMLEMEYVLEIWLKNPPENAATFCRLILTTFLIDRLTTGFMLAVNAHGNIAAYQATVGGCLLLTLPIAWLFVQFGQPPTSVGWAFLVTVVLTSVGRALWVRKLFGVPVREWLHQIVFKCALAACATGAGATIPALLLDPSPTRLVASCVLGAIVCAISFHWVLDKSEWQIIHRMIQKLTNKFSMRDGI